MHRLQTLVLILAFVGCKEYVDAPLSPSEAKRVENALLTARPAPKILLNAKVEDQISYWHGTPKAATTAGERSNYVLSGSIECRHGRQPNLHSFSMSGSRWIP